MINLSSYGTGKVEAVRINGHKGESQEVGDFYVMALDYTQNTVRIHVDGRRDLAKLVTMIADAFEKATGDFLVPRVCASCNTYMGVGTAASQGVTHGTCPECAEKITREHKLDA